MLVSRCTIKNELLAIRHRCMVTAQASEGSLDATIHQHHSRGSVLSTGQCFLSVQRGFRNIQVNCDWPSTIGTDVSVVVSFEGTNHDTNVKKSVSKEKIYTYTFLMVIIKNKNNEDFSLMSTYFIAQRMWTYSTIWAFDNKVLQLPQFMKEHLELPFCCFWSGALMSKCPERENS